MFPRLQFHITPSLKYIQDDQAILSRGLREVLHHLQDLASPIAGSLVRVPALYKQAYSLQRGAPKWGPSPHGFVIVRCGSRCEKPKVEDGWIFRAKEVSLSRDITSHAHSSLA